MEKTIGGHYYYKSGFKTMKSLIISSLFLLVVSCSAQKDELEQTVIYSACGDQQMIDGLCIRYMDRKVYFARNIFSEPNTNNEFDVVKIKEAMDNLANNTNLGEGYFQYAMADKAELDLILEDTVYGANSGLKFKSFIQIWPDVEFNQLWAGYGSADPNAVLIVNQANKKQFFVVFRESCFTTNNANCTNASGTQFSPNKGLYGLVSRNFARLIGVSVKDCADYPVHAMCAEKPSDAQWSLAESSRLYDIFNNQLETIRNNKNFYEVFFPQ